jgi:broad specificity phosphatase PhoE
MTKILLMRHAQSTFNEAFEQLRSKYQQKLLTKPEYLIQVKLLMGSNDPDLLNSKLTPAGISQCQNLTLTIAKEFPKIKRVLLSPFRRVIQTFEESFASHPNFISKNIKVSFIPELREAITTCSDICCWTPNEKEQIKHPDLYNWDWLKSFDEPEFWFFIRL